MTLTLGTGHVAVSYFVSGISVTLQFPPPFMSVNSFIPKGGLHYGVRRPNKLPAERESLFISAHGLAKAIR